MIHAPPFSHFVDVAASLGREGLCPFLFCACGGYAERRKQQPNSLHNKKCGTSSSVLWRATSKVNVSRSIRPTMFLASLIFGNTSRISLSTLCDNQKRMQNAHSSRSQTPQSNPHVFKQRSFSQMRILKYDG